LWVSRDLAQENVDVVWIHDLGAYIVVGPRRCCHWCMNTAMAEAIRLASCDERESQIMRTEVSRTRTQGAPPVFLGEWHWCSKKFLIDAHEYSRVIQVYNAARLS
jgi:hypothetical protein